MRRELDRGPEGRRRHRRRARRAAAGCRAARLALAALGLGCEQPPSPPADGPSAAARSNVLLVTVDTLRADHLSSYGFALPTTPHADGLAEAGVRFERAIAASSSTAPSHASLFTSRYPRQHSIGYRNGDTRLEGGVTLAETLRAAGWATAAFVSNAVLHRRTGLDRGFDTYDDALPEAEANRPLVFERRARETTRRALAWIERAPEPFFLWVHYQDPHGPYDPPEGFAGTFALPAAPDERPLPVLGSSLAAGGVPAYQALPGLRRPSEYRARYADEIHYADHWIGTLLAAPRLRDAVVVLTADHGESLGEHDRWFMHGTTTLPAEAHVPLLLRAPGLAPGRLDVPVSHVDVMPTLLELVGVAVPEGVRGVALGPVLRGAAAPEERVVYCDMGTELSAYARDAIVTLRTGDGGGPRVRRWDGGVPVPTVGGSEALYERVARPLAAYAAGTVPMVPAEAPDATHEERLRALGYVD